MYSVIKRMLDLCLSVTLLILLAPLFLIVYAAIRRDGDGAVLFRQERVGRYGKPFTIYKFRTMSTEAPNVPSAQAGERYLTATGRILRCTSLDELPQLFNVLKGDMSFVGPRPVIPCEVELLTLRRQYGADRVLPGITGLAQILGRDDVTPARKAEYDGEYARRCSFWLDMRIFLASVSAVLKRDGAH